MGWYLITNDCNNSRSVHTLLLLLLLLLVVVVVEVGGWGWEGVGVGWDDEWLWLCVCVGVCVGGGSLSTNGHVIQLNFLSMNVRLVWNTVLLKRSSKGNFLERFLVKTYSHPPKYGFHHPLNPVCPNPQRTSCGRCSWNRPVETPSYGCLRRQRQWDPCLGHPGEATAMVLHFNLFMIVSWHEDTFPHYWHLMRGIHHSLVHFLTTGPIIWSFYVSFFVCMNKLMNNQSCCRWFETQLSSCNHQSLLPSNVCIAPW